MAIVGPVIVVSPGPFCSLFLSLLYGFKYVLVQLLVSNRSIVSLNICVLLRLGPFEAAGVMLSGHTDVVPTTDQKWATDPFRMKVINNKAYGRGTTDMKGYLASVMALANRASRINLTEPLKLAFSYDEEIGCVGIKSMINRVDDTIGLPRYCFVGEPTSMQVAIGHKGKAALRATCHGTSGHSAMAPKFLNALHFATDFISELRNLQDDYALNGKQDHDYTVSYSTIHVGKMSGGLTLSIVPDKAVIDFEFRHLAIDSPNDILVRILAAAQKISTSQQMQFPCTKIDVQQLNAYSALDTNANDEVVSYAQKLAQMTDTTKVALAQRPVTLPGIWGCQQLCVAQDQWKDKVTNQTNTSRFRNWRLVTLCLISCLTT